MYMSGTLPKPYNLAVLVLHLPFFSLLWLWFVISLCSMKSKPAPPTVPKRDYQAGNRNCIFFVVLEFSLDSWYNRLRFLFPGLPAEEDDEWVDEFVRTLFFLHRLKPYKHEKTCIRSRHRCTFKTSTPPIITTPLALMLKKHLQKFQGIFLPLRITFYWFKKL